MYLVSVKAVYDDDKMQSGGIDFYELHGLFL